MLERIIANRLCETAENERAGVVRLHFPEEVKVVGFVGDVVAVVVAKYIHEIEAIANEAIWKIKSWLKTAGLALADHKTEVVLITSRKTLEYFEIRVGNQTALLQVTFSLMLPNMGGPKYVSRVLLS